MISLLGNRRSFGISHVRITTDTKGPSISPDVAVPVCRFGWMSEDPQRARGHVENLKGLVFVCYLSARHRPSQVTATPQPICVISTMFSCSADNVLHPSQSTPPHFSFHPFLSLFYPPPHPAYFTFPFSSILFSF